MKVFRIGVPILVCLFMLAGCGNAPKEPVSSVEKEPASEKSPQTAYASFLAGDGTLLDDTQAETWWIPDFQDEDMEYEYTYLDLDGDGIAELVIQLLDDPYGYNAVFHFENGKIFCWNSDAMEGSGCDYPLADGTMVHQYDFNGTRSYTMFRYQANGETREVSTLFMREEPIPEDSPEPCPYYEIDGEEVDKTEFDKQLDESVTGRMLNRSAWTGIPAPAIRLQEANGQNNN